MRITTLPIQPLALSLCAIVAPAPPWGVHGAHEETAQAWESRARARAMERSVCVGCAGRPLIDVHLAPSLGGRQVWLSGSHVFPWGYAGPVEAASDGLYCRDCAQPRLPLQVAGRRVALSRARASSGVRTIAPRVPVPCTVPGRGADCVWLSGSHGRRPTSVGMP